MRKKRLGAWLLSLVMVLSLMMVPAGTVEAAAVTVTNATNSSNEVYVSFELDATNSTDSYNQYAVNVHNNSSNTICDWEISIQFAGDPGWNAGWNGVTYDSSSKKITIKTYGESSWDNATIYSGNSAGGAGFQIKAGALDGAAVTLTYESGASANGPATGSGSGSGSGSSGGETFDGSNIGAIDTSLDYNFAKLLQYSLYFYDANMCGDKVSETSLYSKELYNGWRGDCHVHDSFTYNGKTYSAVGGYHDAGDHVKFGLPAAQAMTALGLSYLEFGAAFDELGQTNHLKTITDYYCTYVKSCTVLNTSGTQAEAFCYQVGNGAADHNSWVAPEVEDESATKRTDTLVATSSNPATDIVGGTVAALALNYMNFGNEEDLAYAKALFAFAKNNSKRVADYAGNFYHSGFGEWQDEYCLAAALLYQITGDSFYAKEYTANDNNNGNIEKPYGWENAYQAAVFYAPSSSTNKASYTATIQNWFNGVANANSSQYYCGDQWGSARVNCNVQFMMLLNDKLQGTNTYGSWCRYQMSTILGNNATGKNLVCGYNTHSPIKPHHRAASGYSGWTDYNNNATQKYTLYGALCGGPTSSDFSTYNDSVKDSTSNEVAVDYNACLVGSAAALYLLYKDSTDAGFINQTINADFYGGSNFTSAGDTTVEVESVVLNETDITMTVGDSKTLTATVSPVDATNQTVTWSSSDTSVVTVSGGNVKALKAGMATITAKAGGRSASCSVTVKNVPTASLTTAVSSLTCTDLEYGYVAGNAASFVLKNEGQTATSSIAVALEKGTGSKFVITDDVSGNLSAGGSDTIAVMPVTGLLAGTYTDSLIVTYDTGKKITIPISVTVNKRVITIKAKDQNRIYGEENPDMTAVGAWSVISGSLVSGDLLDVTLSTTAAKASDVGNYDILIRVGENPNYSITTQKGSLTVTQKGVTEIVFPTASDITVGETLEHATLEGGDPTFGSYTWENKNITPSRGNYNGNVVLTLSAAAKKNYSFDSISGYNEEKGTVTQQVCVNVKRAGLPNIIFPTASDLQYGQKLSDSMLSGGSTAYGTFEWADGSVKMTETQLNHNNGYNSYDVRFRWNTASKEKFGILDTDEDAVMTKKVAVKVTKADRNGIPSTAVLSVRTANSISVQAAEGVQYSLGNGVWQDGTDFTGLNSFTEYKIYTRYKETATHKAGVSNITPLSVYTLVVDPYTIDVSKVTNVAYVDALRIAGDGIVGEPTASYSNGVLTLNETGRTYTITGSNENVTVQAPNGSITIVLQNATIKDLDVSDALKPVICVRGTSNMEKIKSNSPESVTIEDNGTLNVVQILVSGGLTIDGPTIVADAAGTNGVAVSAGTVTIAGGNLKAVGGTGAAAITGGEVNIIGGSVKAEGGVGAAAIAGNKIYMENSTVEATGGSGASVMETTGDSGSITIKNASVKVTLEEASKQCPIVSDNITLVGDNTITSSTGTDHLYSSIPKDEKGNVLTIYTVIFIDEQGETESVTSYSGGQILLPEIIGEDGYTYQWLDEEISKKYQPKTSYTVTRDVTFVIVKEKIQVTKITLNSTTESIRIGEELALLQTVEPKNAYDTGVTWHSNNSNVATVTQEGKVTGVAQGTAIITVQAKDGSGVTANCKVTVVESEPEEILVEAVKITGATKKLAPGKKLKLKAAVYPKNATNQKVKWKVSNNKYATVNRNGVVTAKNAGKGKKVTVTAYSMADNSMQATYRISVMKNAVEKIKLTAKTTTIKKGQSVTIKAKFTPSKGISKELTWTSSNKKIATVNAKGKVTGKKKGTVKITAKVKDGSGKKATLKIKVK